ncbi:MAG TPA: hypothetical protein P5154_08415, partial [Candidatus Izemoplasmatales bacterium]|nr:hypothetical protein [Candidatus Izemoplasmatales bacterium]
RPFRSNSFAFPVKFRSPCFSVTTTYQERGGLFGGERPRITVHVDGPFFPDSALDKNAAKEKLRDQVYAAMKRTAQSHNEVCYLEYRKKAPEPLAEPVLNEKHA